MTDVAVGALAAFYAVLEERMIGRAASRLGVSQPALTQRIQSLERALNKPVFVRTPAGVELTPAGRVLLQETRASWELWQRTVAGLREDADRPGAVRAAYTLTTEQQVAGLLREMTIDGHDLVVRRLWTSEMSRSVAEGKIDVAFARHPEFWGDLRCELLWETPLVLNVPVGHSLAGRTVVSLRELAGEPLSVVPRSLSPGSYDIVESACLRAGFTPWLVPSLHLVGRVRVSPDVRRLAGVGPALQPEEYAPGSVQIPLEEKVSMGLHMISRHSDGSRPQVQAVLAFMRAAAAARRRSPGTS